MAVPCDGPMLTECSFDTFQILPIMLTGTIAATIANNQPAYQHMDILVGGAACQGLGFWVAVSMYGTFMTRMIKVGLPTPALRPGEYGRPHRRMYSPSSIWC